MSNTKAFGALGVLFATICFFVLSILTSFSPDWSVGRDDSARNYEAYLDGRIPALMRKYGIPGASVALVENGEFVWAQGYGYADVETGREMTADTPFRVQSISKSVTAWAVMKLAEEGRLDIDAPVVRYLKSWAFPESLFHTDRITIRHLLTHTSGLPLGDVYAIYSPGEPMPALRESLSASAVPVRKPGEKFSYSNVGYNLLELVVEEVTGRPFSEYMQSEILLPLGMEHASFTLNKATQAALPMGYRPNGKPVPVYVYPEKASGGLFATAGDIAAFAVAGMPGYSHQQSVLPADAVLRLYEPQRRRIGVYGLAFDAYAMGHLTERLHTGETAVAHGGQGTGWMSFFYAVPEKGDAIVILTNSQRSWPFIAALLHAWARWHGFSAPGMTRLLLGEALLWALAGGVFTTVVLLILKAVRLAHGGRYGTKAQSKA